MKKKYPHLTAMGILHPEQIDRFAVNSVDYTDVLRIVYNRPAGSQLPLTRTYKFPRIKKTLPVGGGSGEGSTVMETDPRLHDAVAELKQATEATRNNRDVASAIIEELRLLEEDIALRSDCIKELVSHITPP